MHDILQFLLSSQSRFRSSFIAMTGEIPIQPSSLPGSPTSPRQLRQRVKAASSPALSSPASPPRRAALALSPPPSPTPLPSKMVLRPRVPLAPKAALVNRAVQQLSQSTSSPSKAPVDELSPFTALPPKLGLRNRLRAKLTSPVKKKAGGLGGGKMDVERLGMGTGTVISVRRAGQFDASLRKLEGTGAAGEQRSDEEDTGVIELEGRGEGGVFQAGFAKSVACISDSRSSSACSFVLSCDQNASSHNVATKGTTQAGSLAASVTVPMSDCDSLLPFACSLFLHLQPHFYGLGSCTWPPPCVPLSPTAFLDWLYPVNRPTKLSHVVVSYRRRELRRRPLPDRYNKTA